MSTVIHRPDSPVRCGRQFSRGIHDQRLQTPQYAIVYILSGHGSYIRQNRSYAFEAGSVLQRFPNQLHSVSFHGDCESVFAAIPAQGFRMLKQFDLPSLQQPVLDIGLDERIIQRFDQCAHDLRMRMPQHLAHSAGQLLQLIIDIHQRANAMASDSDLESFAQKACNALQKDLEIDKHLPSIAESLGFSYANFRKRFKQAMGISPKQFRIQQRIEASKHCLLIGDSITAVADQLGYPDCYSFSKQFKKYTGYTPSTFRKRQGLL